ncbi:hypothetical protein Tco_0359027 [Tanacetum coccineum]
MQNLLKRLVSQTLLMCLPRLKMIWNWVPMVELQNWLAKRPTRLDRTTSIIKKIDKIENLIIDERVTLVDDEGKPLKKVVYLGDYDSEDGVASVNNEMASFLAKKDGYGTQSLLEQWKKSYENDDYEYDAYDDDMYEGEDIHEAICDNLDITVRGCRKK